VGLIVLSDAAVRRLALYCRRGRIADREVVEERVSVPYPGRRLRELVWADPEVRDALLAVDDRSAWDELVEQVVAHGLGDLAFDVLDLATSMSLEASRE
jgi:hypothetical protein